MKSHNISTMYSHTIKMLLLILVLSSCTSEFNENDLDEGNVAPPLINNIADARTENVVQSGVLGNFYWIQGENLASVTSIKYNGFEAGFNPVFVTETLIISRIPSGAPFLNTSNLLTVETLHGTASISFSLLTITDFSEEIVDGKSAVVLNGGDFTDVDRVTFVTGTEELGNRLEVDAEIISVTSSTVTAEVPDGITQAFIFVYSNGVQAQSTSYGFNYPIFTDEAIGWDLGGFGGSQELSAEIALGSTSIKRTSDPFGGLTFLPNDTAETLFVKDYSILTFQVYPNNAETTRIAFAINDFNAQVLIDLVPFEWNRIELPISDFYPPGTEPETIFRMDVQEFAGANAVFYLDQFGFIE